MQCVDFAWGDAAGGTCCIVADRMSRKDIFPDPVLGDLTDDRLTRDYRVFQRAKGHRFSVDDVATAYVAAHCVYEPKRILDLGTGLGSVLLHLAWFFPEAKLTGIEAQEASFELLQRNVKRNQLESRVETIHGDIRSTEALAQAGRDYDLVSGTPPYFPAGAAIDADDVQRTYARVEYRGGVEDYIEAALQCIKPYGRIVLCGDAHSDTRVRSSMADLAVLHRRDVVAKEGKDPLFSIWVLGRAHAEETRATLTLRTCDGSLTDDAKTLRAFSGFETPVGLR
jgi:tRNA1Val (adenine37-N6)-methyltransferase